MAMVRPLQACARMLPPRDIQIQCFSCSRSIGPGDESCPGCGISREVARTAHGELTPAIQQLRVLLGIIVVLSSAIAFVFYDHAKDRGYDGFAVAMPYILTAVVYGGMAVLVPRFPMGVAVFGAVGILIHWAQHVIREPNHLFALTSTAVRIILIAGFITLIMSVRRAERALRSHRADARARAELPGHADHG